MNRITRIRRSVTFAVGTTLALAGIRADAQTAPTESLAVSGATSGDTTGIISAAILGPSIIVPSDVPPSQVSANPNPGSSGNPNLSPSSAISGFSGTAAGAGLGTNASLNSPSTVPGFTGTLVGGTLGTNSNLNSPSSVPSFSGTAATAGAAAGPSGVGGVASPGGATGAGPSSGPTAAGMSPTGAGPAFVDELTGSGLTP
jgi:hypothetical protein